MKVEAAKLNATPEQAGKPRPSARELRMARKRIQRLDRALLNTPQIHALRAAIIQERRRHGRRVLSVTGISRGDGATTIASLLSVSLSRTGSKVLLLEGNFYKPRLHRVFGLQLEDAMPKSIREDLPLEETAVQTPYPKLFLAPASAGGDDPSALFASDAFIQIVSRAKELYDFLVFDSSSISEPDSGAMLLSEIADGTILVARAGRTRRDVLEKAKRLLDDAGISVLGVVLNSA